MFNIVRLFSPVVEAQVSRPHPHPLPKYYHKRLHKNIRQERQGSSSPQQRTPLAHLYAISPTSNAQRELRLTMEPQVQSSRVGEQPGSRSLPVLDTSHPHTFSKPAKRINEGHDVPHFLTTRAYGDIGTFIMQLNTAMCPRKSSESEKARTWQLDETYTLSQPVQKLQTLLQKIDSIIEEAPPDTGPRRFGNVSFRKWFELLESRVQGLLEIHLPKAVLEVSASSDGTSVLEELTPYLLGAFGSSQRLDYGTGHELSFLAFLGCIWKLGGFKSETSQDGALERSLVLGVIEPYVRLNPFLGLWQLIEFVVT